MVERLTAIQTVGGGKSLARGPRRIEVKKGYTIFLLIQRRA
jgi:hypothetical protein